MHKHTLGFKGNRTIHPLLIKAAEAHGLTVQRHGDDGLYKLIPDEAAPLNVAAFLPSRVHTAGEPNVFDLENLTRALGWLHQPSAAYFHRTTDKKLPQIHGLKDGAARAGYGLGRVTGLLDSKHDKAVHQKRQTMHRFMSFALTGSTTLRSSAEPDSNDGEDSLTECCDGTKDKVKERDAWRSEIEIGVPKTSTATLPNITIDRDKGYVFALNDDFLAEQNGAAQKALQSAFWQCVNVATAGRYATPQPSVTLTAAELERFYEQASRYDLDDLVETAQFELDVQDAHAKVKQRVRRNTIKAATATPANKHNQLQELLRTTSAFTPVVQSDYMKTMWWRLHPTDSMFADGEDTPFQAMAHDYAIFFAIAEAYRAKDVVTEAELTALTEEFFPLLSASEHMREIMIEAAQKSKATLPAGITNFKHAFHQASGTTLGARDKMLPEDYQEAIEALDETLQTGAKAFIKSMTVKPVVGFAEAFWDWTSDMWAFAIKDPKLLAAVLAGGYAMYKLSSSSAPPTAEDLEIRNMGMMFGPDGSMELFDPGMSAGAENFHYDIKVSLQQSIKAFLSGDIASPYYIYKHFTNYVMVNGTEQFLDLLTQGPEAIAEALGLESNDDSSFMCGAKDVLYPLAAFYYFTNLVQNATHIRFWAWALYDKGYKHGTKGALQLVELAGPLIDPVCQLSVKMAELTRIKKALSLPERLSALTTPDAAAPLKSYDGRIEVADSVAYKPLCHSSESACPVTALSKAAQARVKLEKMHPNSVREGSFLMKIGGIKGTGSLRENFTINAQNLHAVVAALSQFDAALGHMASKIGADDVWYKAFLTERIEQVTAALEAFQLNKDAAAFQDSVNGALQDVIGADIRHYDRSAIFEALTGHEASAKERARLLGRANHNYGKLKRQDALGAALVEKYQDGQTWTGHKAADLKVKGIWLLDKTVAAARHVEKLDHILPLKTGAIGAAGLLTSGAAFELIANHGDATSEALSYGAGAATAASALSVIFVAYNWFWDDLVVVHKGTGSALMVTGAGARSAQKMAHPFAATLAEKWRNETPTLHAAGRYVHAQTPSLRQGWNAATGYVGQKINAIKASLRDVNKKRGQALISKKPANDNSYPAHKNQATPCDKCPVKLTL